MSENEPTNSEEKPNKGYSFILGIVIGIVIIVLLVIFFNH
jgi:hypothetical protein